MLKQSPINSMRFALRPNAKALCEWVLRAVSDKCLLRGIFGIISILQHSPYNPKHQRSVLVNQIGKCSLISTTGFIDQGLVAR